MPVITVFNVPTFMIYDNKLAKYCNKIYCL